MSFDYNALGAKKQERADLVARMREFVENHKVFSQDDETEYNNMTAALSGFNNEINRLEQLLEAERTIGSPANSIPKIGQTAENVPFNKTKEYNNAFGDMLLGKNLSDAMNVLKSGRGENGEVLVPVDFRTEFINKIESEFVMRKICDCKTTSSNKVSVPREVSKGAVAAWTAETGTINPNDIALDSFDVDIFDLTSAAVISKATIEDSALNIENIVRDALAWRIGAAEEEAFITGNGNGKPTGILTACSVGHTAAKNTAVTFDDLAKLETSVPSAYRNSGVFLANDSILSVLMTLKDANGQYLWSPSQVVGAPDKVHGKDIYFTPYMQALGASKKPIAFGDFKQYKIYTHVNMYIQKLVEHFALSRGVGFVADFRVGAGLAVPDAIKVLSLPA